MSRVFIARLALAALFLVPLCPQPAAAEPACPAGGTIRYGVEPFEASDKLLPVYDQVAKALQAKTGCNVELYIATSYNAEIEAMRNDKLDVAEFGPLGYVLAHQIAHADVFATYLDPSGKGPSVYYASIVTHKSSGLSSLKDVVGKSFAYSDPDSTSGHLFPAYALKAAGIDPDTGVKAVYAGSHTASFEAIKNDKVQAGELNSLTIPVVSKTGEYDANDYVTLWKSPAIPNDPITIRRDLPDAVKSNIEKSFLALNLHTVDDPKNVLKGLGYGFVPQEDVSYNVIRDMVSTLKIDLSKL